MRILSTTLAITLSLTTFAQSNLLNDQHMGFETESTSWYTSDSDLWAQSSEEASAGTYAMKYNVAESATPGFETSLYSIETGYTITNVRSAVNEHGAYIVGSSYEGTVLGIAYDGVVLWENKLSGYMNRDLWVTDLDGDGIDEILAANADGALYCLNSTGTQRWQFKKNDAPMSAVCTLDDAGTTYVVTGGYDMSIYYLDVDGNELLEVAASGYSEERPWGNGPVANGNNHIANFLRPIRKANGDEALALHGAQHTSSAPGHVYLFNPMASTPYASIDVGINACVGHMSVVDTDGNGTDEILVGSSSMMGNAGIAHINPGTETSEVFTLSQASGMKFFGYRLAFTNVINDGGSAKFITLYGSDIILTPISGSMSGSEVLNSSYSYNDLWKASDNTLLMASSQSGGSCVHVIKTNNSNWKTAYEELVPPGKIQKILDHRAQVETNLAGFSKPAWQGESRTVRMLTEDRSGIGSIISDYQANHDNPVFYGGNWTGHAEDWDRSAMANAEYRDRRDGRRTYDWTQQQALDFFTPQYSGEPGISFWGGHGNDPYMFQLSTLQQIIDHGFAAGKYTNIVYPELESHDANAAWMLNDHIYPLAAYSRDKNTKVYIRTKHTFWNGIIYKPLWSRLLSGEFADVFVPSMEETNSKAMDMSIAARMGLWMSGSVDEWGSRCARDNTSYDRLREKSHQMLPNHFLRQMIYNIASGATNQNNFGVDQPYFSIIYDLISSGALYVPERDEIVSISPVHLSMVDVDEEWIEKTNNIKWTTVYDEDDDTNHPAVIGRMNGAWPGAALQEWDYSRYAAGSNERRLEFLPNFPNGMVLFTPAQAGIHADPAAPRGALADNMHPLYNGILKEYYSDGVNYYSADGSQTYAADEYYSTIVADIQSLASHLPLTVKGRVAWVAAQTAPRHLRLTLVDGGYINPDDRTAILDFNSETPVTITDLLSGETFNIGNTDAVEIDIPCGGFRFIDIEIQNEL